MTMEIERIITDIDIHTGEVRTMTLRNIMTSLEDEDDSDIFQMVIHVGRKEIVTPISYDTYLGLRATISQFQMVFINVRVVTVEDEINVFGYTVKWVTDEG